MDIKFKDPDQNSNSTGSKEIKSYFNSLRIKLTIGFLASLIIPFLALLVYFNVQYTKSLKENSKINLLSISESQKNTIDLFVQERVINLFGIIFSNDFKISPDGVLMEVFLSRLRQISNTFIDIGYLEDNGIQSGYAGPFPNLKNRNYSEEKWFKSLIKKEKDFCVTDIYMGFRNKAHFTIAVRRTIDGKEYVIRTTIDPERFYDFIRTMNFKKGIESAIINQEGIYQIVDPEKGEVLKKSGLTLPFPDSLGVIEIENNGRTTLLGYTRLKEIPWILIVREPLDITHSDMYRTRKIITATMAVILILCAVIIITTVGRLISYAWESTVKKREMQLQLVHASKLASVGELATGIAHEINNPLAIIMATSGVIKDMLDPEFDMPSGREDILNELAIIDSSVKRAKNITGQLLDYGRKNVPVLMECNINNILEEVSTGIKERQFALKNIEILRFYDSNIPSVLVDPDQIRQVIFNMINNAGDAIEGPGTITITSGYDEKNIRITISDTGKGMGIEEIKQIFNPFFTTKEAGKGTGLGLSISLSIIESMGGTIDVQSITGAGSSFTIWLPIKGKNEKEISNNKGVENGHD